MTTPETGLTVTALVAAANGGIVGIDKHLDVYGGYDEEFYVASPSREETLIDDVHGPAMPAQERIGLADLMIARWEAYKHAAEANAEQELAALERAIAYDSARTDIECLCLSTDNAGRWYDTGALRDDEEGKEFVARAIRYLEFLGLLERHPSNHTVVRIKDIDPQ